MGKLRRRAMRCRRPLREKMRGKLGEACAELRGTCNMTEGEEQQEEAAELVDYRYPALGTVP